MGLSETPALCNAGPWHRHDTWQLSHQAAQYHYHLSKAVGPGQGDKLYKTTKVLFKNEIKLEYTVVCNCVLSAVNLVFAINTAYSANVSLTFFFFKIHCDSL